MTNEAKFEEHVREVLKQHGLPHDVPIRIGSPPDERMEAAYSPNARLLIVRADAHDLTICHEGAHAEHYMRSGIGPDHFPADPTTRFGMLLLSEGYVGRRLATIGEFITHERASISTIGKKDNNKDFSKTIGEWAQLYETIDQVRGQKFDGSPDSVAAVRITMRLLPLVVAEQLSKNIAFSADLSRRTGGLDDFLLSIVAEVVKIANDGERILRDEEMVRFGGWAEDQLRECGVLASGSADVEFSSFS